MADGAIDTSEPAIVATATKAVNVFFMSRALLEKAPSASAGFKVTHTPYSKPDVLLKSAPQSIESKRAQALGWKNGFFRPMVKTASFPDVFVRKMNGVQPQTRTRRTRQP